jgi:hypothetical protein
VVNLEWKLEVLDREGETRQLLRSLELEVDKVEVDYS